MPDAGRDRRIADVHVERHVDAAGAVGGERNRPLGDPGDAVAVDVLHGEDVDARLADPRLLLLVEIADADEHRVLRQRPTAIAPIAASSAGSLPSSAASGMPCTLPLVVVSGVFMSPCASTQIRPSGCDAVRRTQAALAATDPAARL